MVIFKHFSFLQKNVIQACSTTKHVHSWQGKIPEGPCAFIEFIFISQVKTNPW